MFSPGFLLTRSRSSCVQVQSRILVWNSRALRPDIAVCLCCQPFWRRATLFRAAQPFWSDVYLPPALSSLLGFQSCISLELIFLTRGRKFFRLNKHFLQPIILSTINSLELFISLLKSEELIQKYSLAMYVSCLSQRNYWIPSLTVVEMLSV